MKAIKLITAFVALFTFTNACAQDNQYIPASDIPQEIKDFVNNNFPKNKIIRVKAEKGFFTSEYEVHLNNKIELEFGKNLFESELSIEKIETSNGIPNILVSKNIRDYVSNKYPDSKILSWSDENGGQKIKLSNGLELKFDTDGSFSQIDD